MPDVYLGYFANHELKELYSIFVVGDNKEEILQKYKTSKTDKVTEMRKN